MKKLLFASATLSLFLVSQSALADAAEFTLVTSAGTIAVISWPTAMLGGSTAMSFKSSHKEQVVQLAAVEAAAYLNGEGVGPMLTSIASDNADKSVEQIVDIVLEAAQGL